MITFVNAKINIGLRIVGKRPDGYHNLETLFYPVGKKAGSAENPGMFCDILEVIPREQPGFGLRLTGREVACPVEKNLVYRAAEFYFREYAMAGFGAEILLDKHLPDGAGCGGGSADAAMTLAALAALEGNTDKSMLAGTALRLGADCPFFIYNRPMYAEGIGECLEEIPELDLNGLFLVLVKPSVSISTREAFAGVVPASSGFDLRNLPGIPIDEWREYAVNDFEQSIFPSHQELAGIKKAFYSLGALYASMTGSGSAIYGIFADEEEARRANRELMKNPTIEASYLLLL